MARLPELGAGIGQRRGGFLDAAGIGLGGRVQLSGEITVRAQEFGDGLRFGELLLGAGMEVELHGASAGPFEGALEVAQFDSAGVAQSENRIGKSDTRGSQLGRDRCTTADAK